MKKRGLFLLIVLLVVGLTGCGSADLAEYDPDPYHDAGDNGANDIPDFDAGSGIDPSEGGDIVQTADTPALPTRKIIYEANIRMLHSDIETQYDGILDDVASYTAYVESESITSDKITAVIRVLSTELDDLLNDIKTSGELLDYSKTSEDITNQYSTYEARLDALNTQHDRILELMDQAVDLDDLLILEAQRVEIESELNEVGLMLASYDSLVDYSTINLTINQIEDLTSLLPTSSKPNVYVKDQTTDTIVLEVENNSDNDATIYIDVKDNGEIIHQYERDMISDSIETFVIGDLKSGTTYKFEVSSLEEGSLVSSPHVLNRTTEDTFGSVILNTFDASINSLVVIGKGLVLFITAVLPYAVIGGILYVPFYKFFWVPRKKRIDKHKEVVRENLAKMEARKNKKEE